MELSTAYLELFDTTSEHSNKQTCGKPVPKLSSQEKSCNIMIHLQSDALFMFIGGQGRKYSELTLC